MQTPKGEVASRVVLSQRPNHPTHIIMNNDGTLWCTRCGAYGRSRFLHLSRACLGRAPFYRQAAFKKLKVGRQPNPQLQQQVDTEPKPETSSRELARGAMPPSHAYNRLLARVRAKGAK